MKNIILTLFVLTLFVKLQAQVFVNGVDINQNPDIRIIRIEADNTHGKKIITNRNVASVTVEVSYGQFGYLTDQEGKEMVFNNGAMEVLNFFAKNGWEYKDSFEPHLREMEKPRDRLFILIRKSP